MAESNHQRKWVREEVVILVTEYFRTKNLATDEINESHRQISDFLRRREEILTGTVAADVFRNYAGVRMQSGRIRCLDPDTHYSGMQGTKLQKEVMREYLDNPQKLIAEARQIYAKYDNTIAYYNQNATSYFNSTVCADLSDIYNRFLKYVKTKGTIIDIGAGSGRDVKYFSNCGFHVEGIDAAEQLCKIASTYSGVEIKCERVQEWKPQKRYDGVWANASLIHLTNSDLRRFIENIPIVLSNNGVLFISLKVGANVGIDMKGRYFNGISIKDIEGLLNSVDCLKIVESWETRDALQRDDLKWINIIICRTKEENDES